MKNEERQTDLTLEAVSIPPTNGNQPTDLLIVLHGWGDNAHNLSLLAPEFHLPNFQCIFPNAPFPHPQVPGGRSWYALETGDYQGLPESRQYLYKWLLTLENQTGIPLARTILSGFSQGGAMTLEVGLSLPLAGLCCLSGYLHTQPTTPLANYPPVLIVHGKQDPVVPLSLAQQAKEQLTALGVNVIYQEFNMGHEVSPAVLELMQNFILARKSR
jgi:phospholipase/carboxylesterase